MYYDGIQEVRLSITNHPKCFVIGELQQEGSTVRWREEELSELGCLAGSGGSSKYLVKVHLEELRMSIGKKLQRLFVHVSSLAHSSFSTMRILPMGPKCKSLLKNINIDLCNTKNPWWVEQRGGREVMWDAIRKRGCQQLMEWRVDFWGKHQKGKHVKSHLFLTLLFKRSLFQMVQEREKKRPTTLEEIRESMGKVHLKREK